MIKNILLLLMKPTILVGGQAVIEGVMMRVPGAYATAVRDPEGKVHFDRHNFVSITEKSNFWVKPIFRGMAGLYEAMKMGMATLQWSADIALPEEKIRQVKPNSDRAFFKANMAPASFGVSEGQLMRALAKFKGSHKSFFFIIYLNLFQLLNFYSNNFLNLYYIFILEVIYLLVNKIYK